MDQTTSGSKPSDTTGFEQSVTGTSEEKGAQVEQLEKVQSTSKNLRKRHRLHNHCAKFWPWWLIGTLAFLAVFLPLLSVNAGAGDEKASWFQHDLVMAT